MTHYQHHHPHHHRRLSEIATPRVGLAQLGIASFDWSVPLTERWRTLRDRLLASPRFQRWAASFPLTRPVARRRTRALFDLCAGFVYSQVLLACVKLRLFDMLAEEPQSIAEVARRTQLDAEAAERLLRAATALDLAARRRDGRYGLGPLGAALVGNPAVAAMVEHHTMLYTDLQDPVALLRNGSGRGRTTALGKYWPYAGTGQAADLTADQVKSYSALMAASQPLIAEEVLAAYPLDQHRRLLDVGGGDGTFLATTATRTPGLTAVLFDLPAVAERAVDRFHRAGLADRVATVGGDFLADPLPEGADIVSLVRVIHDHDDDEALAILRAARRALPTDGTLLIAEPLAGTPGAEPVGDAYFGMYLLAMGRGRARTRDELTDLLRQAGFTRVRLAVTHVPLITSVIIAHPDVR